MNIIHEILKWGETAPQKIAHISEGSKFSYAELREHSLKVAGYLNQKFPNNQAPLIVLGHKEHQMLSGFLGSAWSGHPYVPLDSSIPQARLQKIISLVNPCEVLSVSRIREIAQDAAPSAPPQTLRADSAPFYLMFTSGSSGEPKGVVVTQGNLIDFVKWMLAEQSFPPGAEVFLNQAPFSFDLSIMDLYLSLVTGGTLFSITKEQIANPKLLFQTLNSADLSTWVSTPSFAEMCLREPSFSAQNLPALGRFLFCGEVLPHALVKTLAARFPKAQIWNTYGPTEATVATTSILIDQVILDRYNPLPVGRVKPGTSIELFDKQQDFSKNRERGEIVIFGPNVAAGYLSSPELNARSFFELSGQRAYRTGDWGYFEGDLLFCEGRRDTQIKMHGYRIELSEIEFCLRRMEQIQEAVVVPKFENNKIIYLAAFVLARTKLNQIEFQRSVKKMLSDILPNYMLPQRVYLVEEFPINQNGKIDRAALASRLV